MNISVSSFSNLTHDDLSQRAALALAVGKIGSFEYHFETGLCVFDPMMRTLWGTSEERMPADQLFAMVVPGDLPDLERRFAMAVERNEDYEASFRIRSADGPVRWIGARGRVVERAPDGTALRLLGLNWDISRDKEQEERLGLLVKEMNHRMNNAFALIDSMMMLGRETASDLDGFADLMSTQVHALADAHQLVADYFLHRGDAEDRVPLSAVLAKVLRVWLLGPVGKRIELDVEGDPALNPQDIASLAMVFYELATNAVKYSVLGQNTGTLRIRVRQPASDRFTLDWRETLETPRRETPPASILSSTGFGAILTEHCLIKLKAREVERSIDADGFSFRADFPALPIPNSAVMTPLSKRQ